MKFGKILLDKIIGKKCSYSAPHGFQCPEKAVKKCDGCGKEFCNSCLLENVDMERGTNKLFKDGNFYCPTCVLTR